MTGETVTYKGIPSQTCNVVESLELQRWIIDPSSRPYSTPFEEQKLLARSASLTNGEVKNKQSIVEKQLELQRLIIEGPI